MSSSDNYSSSAVSWVREDGRLLNQLRPASIQRSWNTNAEGSALISFGNTRVLCTASFSTGVKHWLRGSGSGWITAEYSMLPRSGHSRSARESVIGKQGGRTHEISRLIGRSLRMAVDMTSLGENMITVDCDVLQADGGTRTAAITGGYVALAECLHWALSQGHVKGDPLRGGGVLAQVAAVSVGCVSGRLALDLPYSEDSQAEADVNLVFTEDGNLVEVQATAERAPFSPSRLGEMVSLGWAGVEQLLELQRSCLAAENGFAELNPQGFETK